MRAGRDLRKMGIEIIGDVPWGTHFCQFYKTRQDLIDILVPYFKGTSAKVHDLILRSGNAGREQEQ